MKCFTLKKKKNYFSPYRIDLWPVLVRFGPNQTDLGPVSAVSDRIRLYQAESEIQKKKKFGHRCACSCVHGRMACPCISDLGAPAQSAHPCFLDGHLFLGCLNLRLPKRVLLLQSLWLLHQSKSGVYSMSIFGLYKLVFHQKQMF